MKLLKQNRRRTSQTNSFSKSPFKRKGNFFTQTASERTLFLYPKGGKQKATNYKQYGLTQEGRKKLK